jgi:5-methylcytosine-specific restriction endonuclease McrA
MRCRVCGVVIASRRYAKLLRYYGYCGAHLPDENRCHARTAKGGRCTRVAYRGSEYCKTHKKVEVRQPKAPKAQPKRVVDYAEYINSAEWKAKAKDAKQRAGYRCQICNKAGDNLTLNAHHRTYKRLGNELPMDITVLCRDCHAKFHDKLPSDMGLHDIPATTTTG